MLSQPNEHIWKSFRNFPGVNVVTAVELCAFDVVNGGLIIAEAAAMEALSARLGHFAKGDRPAPAPQAEAAPATEEEYPVFNEEGGVKEDGGEE